MRGLHSRGPSEHRPCSVLLSGWSPQVPRTPAAFPSCTRTRQPSPTALHASPDGGIGGGGCPEASRALQEPCEEAGPSVSAAAQGPAGQHINKTQLSSSNGSTRSARPGRPGPASGIDPPRLTQILVNAQTVAELGDLLHAFQASLNSIHVAAALVKLAKLVKRQVHGQEDGGLLVKPARQHQHTHKHRRPQVQQGSQTTVMSEALLADLCSKYVEHIPDYSTARQHANVCWALGQLHTCMSIRPAPDVLHALETALLASDAQLLRTANCQELSNLALGLTHLGHISVPLLQSLYQLASNNLSSFKPQELSNLAWAGCRALSAVGDASTPLWSQPSHQSSDYSIDTSSSPFQVPELQLRKLRLQLLCFIDQAAGLASCSIAAYKPQEVANLLLACCAHSGRPTPHINGLCAAALPALKQHAQSGLLSDQDVGNSAWAYAKLHQLAVGHQFLDALSPMLLAPLPASDTAPAMDQQQPHSSQRHTHRQLALHRYGSLELCNLLWACATLRYQRPGQGLASQLLQELSSRRHTLSSQALANSAWAAARLGLPNIMDRVALTQALTDHKGKLQSGPVQHAVNTLWACSSLPPYVCSDPAMQSALDALVETVHAQLHQCRPTALAQLSWAAGWAASAVNTAAQQQQQQAQPMHSQHRRQQSRHAGRHSGHQPPQESPWQDREQQQVTDGSHPSASSSHWEQPDSRLSDWFERTWSPLLVSLSKHASDQLTSFSAQHLSVLSQGLSYAQRKSVDHELFTEIGDVALVHIQAGRFNAGGIAGLLAAFVRAGVPHRLLGHTAADAAVSSLDQYGPTQLANFMWALASMRVTHQPLLDRTAHLLLTGPLAHLPSISRIPTRPVQRPTPPPTPQLPPQPAPTPDTRDDTRVAGASALDSRSDSGTDSEELPELAPRSHAGSLLKQLGWEQEWEDEAGDAGPWDRPRHHTYMDVHDLPWVHSHQQPSLDMLDPSYAQHLFVEPSRSSPAMVWTVLAWAFARSTYNQHLLYDRLATAILCSGCHLPEPPPAAHADAAAAAAQSALAPDGVISSRSMGGGYSQQPPVTQHQQALSELTTNCLVQLLWAFASREHTHPSLFHDAAPVLAARILQGCLTTRQVATVAWAYARVQQYEPLLFRAVLREAMTNSNRYGLRDWSRLAWSFSTLCLPSEEAFFMRLNQLQRQHNADAERVVHARAARDQQLNPPGMYNTTTSFSRPAVSAHTSAAMSHSPRSSAASPGMPYQQHYPAGTAGARAREARGSTSGSSSASSSSSLSRQHQQQHRVGGARASLGSHLVQQEEQEQDWLSRPLRSVDDFLLPHPSLHIPSLKRPTYTPPPPSPPPDESAHADDSQGSSSSMDAGSGSGSRQVVEGSTGGPQVEPVSSTFSSGGTKAGSAGAASVWIATQHTVMEDSHVVEGGLQVHGHAGDMQLSDRDFEFHRPGSSGMQQACSQPVQVITQRLG